MADNKFYWIKLKTNFFGRDEIEFLLSQPNGAEYVVLYQMLCLNTANNNGRLETRMGEVIIPYNAKKIARDCKFFDIDTVNVAMSLYRKLGLIYEEHDEILRISNYEEMVGSESANRDAIKKREYRLKQKIKDKLGDNQGTKCLTEYRDKSIENRDKILDIDKEIDNNEQSEIAPVTSKPSKSELSKQYQEEFETLWKHYPNKKGKDQAKNKYLSSRKQGVTYEEIAQGLKNYIAYIKAKKIEDKYIKHGSTWFSQKCWNDDYSINDNTEVKKDEQMEILKGVYNGTIEVN